MSLPLDGRCVLVTRPIQQSAVLAQGIRDAGGNALVFPAIEIQPVADDALARQIDRLEECTAAIFISPNAAQYGTTAVRVRREFPPHLTLYALGPGTARELTEQGVHNVIQSGGQDSEALLVLPDLQNIVGQRIVIFRGVGGREWLADNLKARCAHVEYAECYRRVCPAADTAPLLQRWSTGGVHAVTITSAETLHNLVAMLGDEGAAYLRTTPLFASHEKIAETARQFGIHQVITTTGGDAGFISGLITWFQTHA